ncbi:MAG TPA: iron-containing alcohol dehydrogenase [Bacteroidales bacterium]|nr:iron-containing alcohol dehydrogenase [Bacteroidales bacterium]HON21423.1 iron-containing alcohol dehydrogenase [Bacteroidales bacterium]HOR81510.1 iron-containing alcohol dehydrogenase [Bacteroidales bacterium]HPJ90685.1 iron-containing alcohol dehydrogenase [Bacteroidales bacterium]HQB19777.1 iron-containing alcohol dehydrogenase [Bacteroidales bacterium]
MYNFTFKNPTKLIFGKGSIANLSTEIPIDKKLMLTFGGGSVKTNNVYNQVVAALERHDYIEFWGIEPNPTYETLMEAVALCRKYNVDYLLAVGGGSVIDGTKFIAAAIHYAGDPWEIVLDDTKIKKVIPLATVLTLPATGSEMNGGSVISKQATCEKYAFHHPLIYPAFSVLDPESCYSLPIEQISAGIADTFIHILEQYLTTTNQSMVMDRFAEGLLLTLIELAPQLIKNHKEYDTMANFMLTATMGLNGFISMGVKQDWATHMIGHELTALTGITHGVSLAIVGPALMQVMRDDKREKLLQYAERVWKITGENKEHVIDKAINHTADFYRSIGIKTRLSEHNVGDDIINEIVERFRKRNTILGENRNINADKVLQILNLCK